MSARQLKILEMVLEIQSRTRVQESRRRTYIYVGENECILNRDKKEVREIKCFGKSTSSKGIGKLHDCFCNEISKKQN